MTHSSRAHKISQTPTYAQQKNTRRNYNHGEQNSVTLATTIRMPSARLQFGILLLLGMSLGLEAFSCIAPARSSLPLRDLNTVPSTPSLSNAKCAEEVIKETEDSIAVVIECNNDLMQAITGDIDTQMQTKTKHILPWLGVFVCLMFTQFVFDTPVLEGLKAPQNVAYSAVSATMLRATSSRAFPSWNIFAAAAFLAYQVSQGTSLLPFLSTGFSEFTAWYLVQLEAFPLITKAITTGVIGFTGDAAAQMVEQRIRSRKEDASSAQLSFPVAPMKYDRRRGVSILADGVLVSGPLLHIMYNWLEHLVPVAGTTGLSASLAALTQVLIDDFVLDSIFVAIMFVTTGIGEGHARGIIPQFKNEYFSIVRASWMTSIALIPIQFMCFRFLPLSFRVLGINFIDIIWGAMVSFMAHRNRKGHDQQQEVEVTPQALTPTLQM